MIDYTKIHDEDFQLAINKKSKLSNFKLLLVIFSLVVGCLILIKIIISIPFLLYVYRALISIIIDYASNAMNKFNQDKIASLIIWSLAIIYTIHKFLPKKDK